METNLDNEREKLLWKMAKKRVGFRRQLASYIIVNSFLWALWLITDQHCYGNDTICIPWPIWCTLGWGVGIAFSYYGAFIANTPNAVEKEFEKLKGKGNS